MEPQAKVLIVADWAVDPAAAVAAARARAGRGPTRFSMVVPAWLHGLDWVGDPNASRPCAFAQRDALAALLASAGIQLAHAAVGDPDPVTAVCDELDRWEADELLLCTHGRGFVGFRTARVTGLPVDHVLAPFAGRNGHCVAAAA